MVAPGDGSAEVLPVALEAAGRRRRPGGGLRSGARAADSGLLQHDLGELFVELGETARRRGAGVLYTVDEVQFLARDDLEALIVALHEISQEGLPLLVAAAGLPSALGKVGEARSYAERLFEFRTINSLGEDDARAALRAPAEAQGIRFRPEALDRIVEETAGYPYFLQEFGSQSWNLAAGPEEITAAEVEAAIPLVHARLDAGFFRVRYDRAGREERSLLSAMASLGPGPHDTEDVGAALGTTAPELESRIGTLTDRGLWYSPRDGVLDFTVPMFDRFLRRTDEPPTG